LSRRVVFDTTTVVSALLFAKGRLAWLVQHWQGGAGTPLISSATASELTRVLGYSKFHLSPEERQELLANYILYCEIIESATGCPQACCDTKDQPFLDLAYSGRAELLVTGGSDLLVLAGQTDFLQMQME